jgi:hypothetical protein
MVPSSGMVPGRMECCRVFSPPARDRVRPNTTTMTPGAAFVAMMQTFVSPGAAPHRPYGRHTGTKRDFPQSLGIATQHCSWYIRQLLSTGRR